MSNVTVEQQVTVTFPDIREALAEARRLLLAHASERPAPSDRRSVLEV